jgi:hypothetical protein
MLDMDISGQSADPEISVQNDNCRQIGGSCVKRQDELEPPEFGGPPTTDANCGG